MSRTIRNPPLDSPSSANRYRPRMRLSDLLVLKGGKPPVGEPRDIRVEHTYTTRVTDRVDMVERRYHDGDRWNSYMEEVYRYKTVTVTRLVRERNPAFDQDVHDAYNDWLYAHGMLYRDRMHHRQRRRAIRLDKQAFHQRERSRQKQAIRILVDDILEHGYQDLLGHGVGSYRVLTGVTGW